jgi:hypothetical protein
MDKKKQRRFGYLIFSLPFFVAAIWHIEAIIIWAFIVWVVLVVGFLMGGLDDI